MLLSRWMISFRTRFHNKYGITHFVATLHSDAQSTVAANAIHVSPSTLRTKLIKAINQGQYNDASQQYTSIVEKQQSKSALSANDLQYIINILMKSSDKESLAFCMRLVEDAIDQFHINIENNVYLGVLDSIIASRHMELALKYLTHPPYGLQPTRKHFIDVMTYYAAVGDLESSQICLEALKRHNYTPTLVEYALIIDATFRQQKSVELSDFLPIFEEMQRSNIPFDGKIIKLLRKGSASLHLQSLDSHQLIRQYRKMFAVFVSKAVLEGWLSDMRRALVHKGANAAIRKFEIYQEAGLIADERTLSAVNLAATTVDQLRAFESAMGVRADVVSWSNLVKNIRGVRGLPAALEAYKEAKSSGIRPDWIMVYPLLVGLCQSSIKEVPEANLQQALEIYHDIDQTAPDFSAFESLPDVNFRDSNYRIKVYNVLLKALTSAPRRQKYFHIAKDLLNDMFERQIPPDTRTLTSIALLLIRAAPDDSEAYSAYEYFKKVTGHLWNKFSWRVILNAFCERDLDTRTDLLVQNHFDIVRDMEEAGYTMQNEIYGILFKRYAKIATVLQSLPDPVARAESQFTLEAAIRRTHNMLVLDSTITPDVILWNQIMDAYSRVGAFSTVLQLWNALYVSRRVNNTSVSIILDSCAFAGAYVNALSIWTSLHHSGFKLNYRNWNTWIECLCRLGYLDSAVRTACLEMTQQGDDIQPDADIILLLLGFAMRTGQQEEVKHRVKRYLPRLWDSIPEKEKNAFCF